MALRIFSSAVSANWAAPAQHKGEGVSRGAGVVVRCVTVQVLTREQDRGFDKVARQRRLAKGGGSTGLRLQTHGQRVC